MSKRSVIIERDIAANRWEIAFSLEDGESSTITIPAPYLNSKHTLKEWFEVVLWGMRSDPSYRPASHGETS